MRLLPVVLLGLAMPWLALAADVAKVVNPWVREAPPDQQVLAAYMTVENPGSIPLHLTGVTSPLFARVEMHRTIQHDGMAMMEAMGHMEVPAAGKLVMAPGGLHLMLITPSKPVRNGDKVALTLNFGSVSQQVEAVVKAGDGAGQQHQQHKH